MATDRTRWLAVECEDLPDDQLLRILSGEISLAGLPANVTTRDIMALMPTAPSYLGPEVYAAFAGALYAFRHGSLDQRAEILEVAAGSLVDGAVSAWKLDEVSGDRLDSIGSNNLVPSGGGVTSVADPERGTVAVLEGTLGDDNFLSCDPSSPLSPPFTFAGWINRYGVAPGTHDTVYLFGLYPDSEFVWQPDVLTVTLAGTPLSVEFEFGGVTMPAGEWHHYVVTVDLLQGRCFQDGVEVEFSQVPYEVNVINPIVALGLNHTVALTDRDSFSASSFQIWDRVLSNTEIVALFNSGFPYPA